jgi:hypothetical protein
LLEQLLVNGDDAEPTYVPMRLQVRDTSGPPPR